MNGDIKTFLLYHEVNSFVDALTNLGCNRSWMFYEPYSTHLNTIFITLLAILSSKTIPRLCLKETST
jgi:hypothetical protein